MNPSLKSNKAAIEGILAFMQNVMLFAAILMTGFFLNSTFILGVSSAEDSNRNLVTTFDIVMLGEELSLERHCPRGRIYLIDENRVEVLASKNSLGSGEIVNYFLTQENVQLPRNLIIDCNEFNTIQVSKSIENNLPTLRVEGTNEQ